MSASTTWPAICMNIGDIQNILFEVSFPGWVFQIGGTSRYWLRGVFPARDSVTGELAEQRTRRWYISREATRSEVVQTALKCVLTAVEHEARENFRYRGEAIFGPHMSVDALHLICSHGALDERAK